VTVHTEQLSRYTSRSDLWFTKTEHIDFDYATNFSKEIDFNSIYDERHKIEMTFNFDGQTRTLRFRKIVLVDEDNAFKSREKKNAEGGKSTSLSKSSSVNEGKARLIHKLELSKFSLSIIGKVQELKDD